MWLTSNWVQLLGKNRPTEKDKVFYINLDKDTKYRLLKHIIENKLYKKA